MAWSDDWNLIDSHSVLAWRSVWDGKTYYEWGIQIDAAPRAGVAYGYDDFGYWGAQWVDWTMEVGLRKSKSSSGTTDIVAKTGYTTKSVTMGASISGTPSITLTPSSDTYQRASNNHFDY